MKTVTHEMAFDSAIYEKNHSYTFLISVTSLLLPIMTSVILR